MTRLLAYIGFVCLLLCSGSWGCNPPPKPPGESGTCLGDTDCPKDNTCASGLCVRREAVDGDGGINREASVDQSGPCVDGDQRPCASARTEQRNKGICKDGLQTCSNGVWGKCIGEVRPNDTDNCDGLDNDCDGKIDNDCDCQPGDKRACGEGLGACAQGTETCEGNGKWGACIGGVEPAKEKCDGLDNDCDGEVDEDFLLGKPCTAGVGACAVTGTYICDASGDKKCDATPGQPTQEKCNGIDDDCDGQTDERFDTIGLECDVPGGQGPCAKGKNACKNGRIVCESGQSSTGQKETLCDDKDDDCDGLIDEDFIDKGKRCVVGKGTCQQVGTLICDPATKTKVICNKQPLAPTAQDDKICDGKDEDCDGTIDEDCPCNNGETRICYSGTTGCTNAGGGWSCVSPCTVGKQECKNSAFGACVGETLPASELCDGKDNDCDGVIDNGDPGSGQPCSTGGKGECGKGKTSCQGGQIVCNAIFTPKPEVCDGKDNDCNGTIDDGNPSSGLPCQSGKPGACASGLTACSNGAVVCVPTVTGSKEVCDGKDNDCNGQIDDGNPGGGAACKASTALGICQEGTLVCAGGKLTCSPGAKRSETCDGKDEDCDGKVDNGLACRQGDGSCGGIGGQEKRSCKSDCSGFEGKGYCDPIFKKEACYKGSCVKCGCTLGERKCDGSKSDYIFKCKLDSAGKCGFMPDEKCNDRRRCRSGLLGPYCGR